jgi:hypothetical protein
MRKKCENVVKKTVVQCNAMQILIPFSHHIRILQFFAFFAFLHYFLYILRIFFALFTTFWCINRGMLTKKVEKVQKKSAKSAMQMRNANVMRKKCHAMR